MEFPRFGLFKKKNNKKGTDGNIEAENEEDEKEGTEVWGWGGVITKSVIPCPNFMREKMDV